MSEVKHKIYWLIIDGVNGYQHGFTDKKPSGISGGGSNKNIKVIEYSAYQQAIDKIKRIEIDDIEFAEERDHWFDKLKNLEQKISLLEQDLESEKRSHQITKDSSNEYITELHNDLKKLREALEELNLPKNRSFLTLHLAALIDNALNKKALVSE